MGRANGDHGGLQWINVARHHRLQGHDQAAHDDDGVDRLVGTGGMPTLPFDFDFAGIGGRHERACAKHESTNVHARMVVKAKNSITGKTFKQAVGNHLLRATVFTGLLCRLKNQVHSAFELPRFGQLLSSAQQHGCVAIVSASMHGAGVFTGVRLLGLLLDGERIHVCAQCNAFALTIFQSSHQAVTTDIARDVITPCLKLVSHPLSR